MNSRVGKPDILIIVMDAVRASDFRPGDPEGYLPHLRRRAKEFVRFDRAVSPASWTLPSHASLFTGMYPWEHGLHSLESLKLKPEVPTLARVLRPLGYSSLSISANFLLGGDSGLVTDFDKAYWGGWWEPYLRFPKAWRLRGSFPGAARMRDMLRQSGRGRVWQWLWPQLQRHSSSVLKRTYLLDMAQRLLAKFAGSDELPPTSSWLEPTLDYWLGARKKEEPVLVFLNLLDAHEPYFRTGGAPRGLGNWLRYVRTRQDRKGWVDGTWKATSEELALLHELYRDSIGALDQRVEGIIDMFQQHDRWENALICLTSDHGQAFGENGHLFHITGVTEEMVRIPLWVRYPAAEMGGATVSTWSSLTDVVPTVTKLLGRGFPASRSSPSLRDLAEETRQDPVFTVSDGLGYTGESSPEIKSPGTPEPVYVAAYQDRWKVVIEARGREPPSAFEVEHDELEPKNVWDAGNPIHVQLRDHAASVAARLVSVERKPMEPEVAKRLGTWGYI